MRKSGRFYSTNEANEQKNMERRMTNRSEHIYGKVYDFGQLFNYKGFVYLQDKDTEEFIYGGSAEIVADFEAGRPLLPNIGGLLQQNIGSKVSMEKVALKNAAKQIVQPSPTKPSTNNMNFLPGDWHKVSENAQAPVGNSLSGPQAAVGNNSLVAVHVDKEEQQQLNAIIGDAEFGRKRKKKISIFETKSKLSGEGTGRGTRGRPKGSKGRGKRGRGSGRGVAAPAVGVAAPAVGVAAPAVGVAAPAVGVAAPAMGAPDSQVTPGFVPRGVAGRRGARTRGPYPKLPKQ